MIAVVASLCLIFIMLGITKRGRIRRHHVSTVALSLGSSLRIVGPHLAKSTATICHCTGSCCP